MQEPSDPRTAIDATADGATDEKPNRFALPDGRIALCRGSDRLIVGGAQRRAAARAERDAAKRSAGPRGAAHPRALYDELVRDAAVNLKTVHKLNHKQIAAELGCHRKSVARWLREAGVP